MRNKYYRVGGKQAQYIPCSTFQNQGTKEELADPTVPENIKKPDEPFTYEDFLTKL
jgi:hypothetical protein